MKLPKVSSVKISRGFTLIEVLIVLAIVTMLVAFGLMMSMETFRGQMRRSELEMIVTILARARSHALSNVGQTDWGACLDNSIPTDPLYIIFGGANYAGAITTLDFPGNAAVVIDTTSAPDFLCSSGEGIVFEQLTGNTEANSMTLTQGPVTSTITTNALGRIDW